ncbi:hypothetical protein ACTXT7_008195 [Hymenolepis weldensis]
MTRKKFVPLFSESGTGNRMVVLLPGRHPCQCLAVRHRLIVLSAEERKYAEMDTNAARRHISRIRSTPWAPGVEPPPWIITRKLRRRYGNRLKGKTMEEEGEAVDGVHENSVNESEPEKEEEWNEAEAEIGSPPDIDAQTRLVKALVQRDRLLHFDATTAKRTRVIDDEVDYFVSEGGGGGAALWLDPQTRARVARRVEELRAQRRALRSQAARALTINFTNMTVSEQHTCSAQVLPTDEDFALLAPSAIDKSNSMGISDPFLNVSVPQFIPPPGGSNLTEGRVRDAKRQQQQQQQRSRVQDTDQQKIEDRGFCLSMHQPWASLLVRGVKIHEGRSWYSAHRGPLWIAAAARNPDEEEVRAIEADYLRRRGEFLLPIRYVLSFPRWTSICVGVSGAKQVDFPTSYPTGVLVGCVNVDEVLPQKEYRLKFPDGESESPYVFVCSDPRELLIKLPMSGQHKICELLNDLKVHILSVPCKTFVEKGDKINLYYTGRLRDNRQEFDSNVGKTPLQVIVGTGQLFDGFDQGLLGTCEGEHRRLLIPSSMGHGSKGYEDVIPPFSDLELDIKVVSIEKKAERHQKQTLTMGLRTWQKRRIMGQATTDQGMKSCGYEDLITRVYLEYC